MIDLKARQRLQQDQQTKSLWGGLFNSGKVHEQAQETIAMMKEFGGQTVRLEQVLTKISQALVMIWKRIPSQIVLPKVYPVKGEVAISNPIKVQNFDDVTQYLKALIVEIKRLKQAVSVVGDKEPIINIPPSPAATLTFADKGEVEKLSEKLDDIGKSIIMLANKQTAFPDIKFPKSAKFDLQPVIDAIDRIPGGNGGSQDIVDALIRVEEGIGALYNRPQMSTPPVTNVSINALRGVFMATQVTIKGTPTLLPPNNLANRRSMIIYNASANTIYLGGSTVAAAGTGQGLPVVTNTLSPSFDAGDNMQLFGIATANSVVNVLEISNNNIGM